MPTGGDKINTESVCGLLSTFRPEAIPLCHQIAGQCEEQRQSNKQTYIICNPTRTNCQEYDNYWDCLKSSAMLAFQLTPPKKTQSEQGRVGSLLTTPVNISDVLYRVLAPIQPDSNTSDKQTTAKALLTRFGLMKPEEQLSQILSGQIVDVHIYPQNGSDQLVIIFPEVHNSNRIQIQIADSLKTLQSRGLRFIGLEGIPDGHRITSFSCSHENLLWAHIGCKLSAEMFVFGTENSELLEQNIRQFNKIGESLSEWTKIRECGTFKSLQEAFHVAGLRSSHIVSHLIAVMQQFHSMVVALPVGGLHLSDFQSELKQRNINYIVVSVTAYTEFVRQSEDAIPRRPVEKRPVVATSKAASGGMRI